MFRSAIVDGKKMIGTIANDVKHANKFQGKLKGTATKILKQKVGEVKKTLPHPSNALADCMKGVGDKDMCGVIATKYEEFYSRMCGASPALCDDYHSTPINFQPNTTSSPRMLPMKRSDGSILI